MPIPIHAGRSSILVRKVAFERVGLQRSEIDKAFNLTADECQVEGGLIVFGPLPTDELAGSMAEWLEQKGLAYFEDYFELSGNWPEWVKLFAGLSRQ